METLLIYIVGGAATVVLIVSLALWYAFAATVLWGWFIAPLFGGPVLTLWQMWGVMLTLGMMRPTASIHKDDRPIDWSLVVSYVLGPALALLVGSLIK